MLKSVKMLLPLLAVLVLVGGGCSGESIATELEHGTAKTVYKEAFSYAQTQHADAVLVGFNNQELSFDRINMIPDEADLTGDMPYWTFIFAKSSALLEDGVVNDSDVFGVEFFNKELIYTNFAQTRDASLGKEYATGEYLLEVDSDALFTALLAEITTQYGSVPTVAHFNINARPDSIEMTLFTSATAGYDAIYSPVTKEFAAVRPVEFVSM